MSTVDTKICPTRPRCGREFQPASFDEESVMREGTSDEFLVVRIRPWPRDVVSVADSIAREPGAYSCGCAAIGHAPTAKM